MTTNTKIYPIHRSSIDTINELARKACYQDWIDDSSRRGGQLERELEWNEECEMYVGFLSDWDGECRTRLMYSLMDRGFHETMYEAPYFWTLSNNIVEISYTEGDLYAKVIEKSHD